MIGLLYLLSGAVPKSPLGLDELAVLLGVGDGETCAITGTNNNGRTIKENRTANDMKINLDSFKPVFFHNAKNILKN
jgi:hypothetical protein